MEGMLECKIGFIPHRYYFVLHECILKYSKAFGKRQIGQLHLSVCKID